jgi:hypothetical protein
MIDMVTENKRKIFEIGKVCLAHKNKTEYEVGLMSAVVMYTHYDKFLSNFFIIMPFPFIKAFSIDENTLGMGDTIFDALDDFLKYCDGNDYTGLFLLKSIRLISSSVMKSLAKFGRRILSRYLWKICQSPRTKKHRALDKPVM